MSATSDTRDPGDTVHTETQQRLQQMINGFRVSQLIHAAAKLGIADLVADGPKSSAELAKRTGTHARSLYRLLRALAGYGVFAEDERGRFALTPLAELLRTGVPGSARAWATYVGDARVWRPWGELLYSITTGGTAFRHVYGVSNWGYRADHPEANTIFNDAMTALSNRRIGDVMAAYDFSGIKTIVDVGGGHGALIAAILRANPTMHGILFDAPHVVAGAHQLLATARVAERCQIVGGNFFEGVPGGGDAYILSKVIHDWSDDRAAAILRACHRTMTEHGKLLLVEAVISPGNGPHPGKLSDLNMLVMTEGGCERTTPEFQALLGAAGFTLTRVVPTRGESSVIEARRTQ